MVPRPMLVRFLVRPQLLTRLSPLLAAKNIPPVPRFGVRRSHVAPTQGGCGPRLHGGCRTMALSQPLPDITTVALSPQTAPMQGGCVP